MPAAFITVIEAHLSLIVGLAAGTSFTVCVQLVVSEVRRRRRQQRDFDRKSRSSDIVRGP